MAFWQWSTSAGSNATADPTINWAEGMAPSAVNDSARAMMARLAEWRNDISGMNQATSTDGGNNYAISPALLSAGSPPAPGSLVGFYVNVPNLAGAGLSVDNGASHQSMQAPSGTPLPAGALVPDSIYSAVFDGPANVWLLRDLYSVSSPVLVPLGGIVDYCGTTAPASFLFAAGQPISQTTYALLYSLFGPNRFGTDSGGNFNLPDLRGRVAAGLDNMNGSAAGRIGAIATDNGTIVGTTLGSTGGQSTHSQTLNEMATYTPAGGVGITVNGPNDIAGSALTSFNINGLSGGPVAVVNTGGTLSTPTAVFTGTTHTQSAATVVLPPTIMLNKIIRVL